MADNRIVFRISNDLASELEARSNGESLSLNLTAKRDLERYYYVLSRSMPELTEAEASLICDVMNGTINEPVNSIRMLPIELDDADRSYYEKWGVDKRALVAHIRSLTTAGLAAIVDGVERFWKNRASHPRDVGLCK